MTGERNTAEPLVPIAQMDDETLARYRDRLARRVHNAPPRSPKREALQSILGSVTAEEVARKRDQPDDGA